jgi:hypothetical protein
MTDDPDLRARFASLRQSFERRMPSFDSVIRRARAGRRPPLRALAVAPVLVVLVFAATLLPWTHRAPSPALNDPNAGILAWKAPTDFLLDIPGRELLQSVPTIGEMPDRALFPGSHPIPTTMRSVLLEKFS